jgi:soluble lytic murein transglycosylase
MQVVPRRISILLLAAGLLGAPRPASAQDVMPLVRADRWAEAEAAAAQYADPVARKLVTYYRLLAPGAASAAEIAAFMATSPDWPFQSVLARRRDDALANDPDDGEVVAECAATPPHSPLALAHCADAYGRLGRTADATAMARHAWIAFPDDPPAEAEFLRRFAPMITSADQWSRFDRLAWTDNAAAARQEQRLAPSDHARAEARLALRRDAPNALALLAALPANERADPAMMLEQARFLRRADQDDAALALWVAAGTAAERAAPPGRRPAFWDERNILIRRRLRTGDAPGAYQLADGHAQTSGEALVDAEFLAGFIALRRLNDTASAARHFQHLANASRAAITQGRAHYWLGRTAEAQGDAATARAQYGQSAAWPNTFYGQLAALRLGDTTAVLAGRILAVTDPPAGSQRALDLAGRELARAAAYLVGWGEPHRAQAFLLQLNEVAPDPPDRALAARLSNGFGMPEAAIAVTRRAGTEGVMLMQAGWPLAADIPKTTALEPALALGIIRQESSFDSSTVSPAGARGLMQLMPATATQLGRQLVVPVSVPALTQDSSLNIRLGTAYLRQLLDQFGGSIPLAVAAYNAGPNRVQEWLGTNGDPRTTSRATSDSHASSGGGSSSSRAASGGGSSSSRAASGDDMIDWIELIPFGETRNYVQRVIENQMIYRAKRGDALADPVTQ